MVKKELLKKLVRFKKKISLEYPMKKMLLFGSQADGTATRESDVDLILVSVVFEGQRILARSVQLYLDWDLDVPVDFVCYTPEEFAKRSEEPGLVRNALKNGIEI
ncbi:MAG: nucleotidyltransferase domain-containing protein [Candidatus Woesearchaeota archaeon]|nr:nucleotidyltransferase domain-containing protein [Candidatus Woesearchaeota archaeon]